MTLGGQAARIALAILPQACWLIMVGLIVSFALVHFSSIRPMVAARDAVLNEHMRQQAYARTAPASDLSLTIVSIGAQACVDGTADVCLPTPLIDRSELASLLRTAVAGKPKVVMLDVVPARRAAVCDAETLELLSAISSASKASILILATGLAGKTNGPRVLPTLLEDCPGTDNVELANVFFGHPVMSEVDGLVAAIDPWIVADMPGEADAELLFRRRIPSLALVLSEAMRSETAADLRARMDSWGLETRLGAAPRRAVDVSDQRLCKMLPAGCGGSDRNAVTGSSPQRINFHFGWLEFTPVNPGQIDNARQLKIVGNRFFNGERAAAMVADKTDGVIIGGGDAAYGDIHYTPIGRVPGSLIIANAAFNFDQNGFLRTVDPGWNWVNATADCVGMALQAAAGAFLLAMIATLIKTRRRRKVDGVNELNWSWPVALMVTSVIGAQSAWGEMHDEFDSGLLTFTIVAFGLAVLELRTSLEEVMFHLYSRLVEGLKGAWGNYRRRSKA